MQTREFAIELGAVVRPVHEGSRYGVVNMQAWGHGGAQYLVEWVNDSGDIQSRWMCYDELTVHNTGGGF